jgi:hypothetical protein
MNDPHIDIDEIDNPDTIPPASDDSGPKERPKEPAGGFGFSDLLERMGERANRWQDRLNAGAKMGLDMHIIPPEAKKHMISSQREFLLAWRALIDYSLERLNREEERVAAAPDKPDETPKVEKIQVEEF